MSPLDRKLLRDLKQLRGQALSIALVVACGVASYAGMKATFVSLEAAATDFYARSRFADVFVHAPRVPRTLLAELAEIEGVALAAPRIVDGALVDLQDLPTPAFATVLSLPEGPDAPNQLHLREGRLPEPDRYDEVAVSEPFAKANGLGPGSTVSASIGGRRRTLRVTGLVLSAEHLMPLAPGALVPDDRRVGVLALSRPALEAALRLDGAFSDVAILLQPGASEAAVRAEVDRLLAPWGATASHGRALQPSYRYVQEELSQLQGFASKLPALFLAVAAFLVNLVLGRLVGAQREQIAALKALGYDDAEIGWHYGKLGGIIVLGGALLGLLLSWAIGESMIEQYRAFYRFPELTFRLDAASALGGLGAGAGTAGIGAAAAVWRVMQLPPAEAMRPEAPPDHRRTSLEALGLYRLLTAPARMIARDLERRPLRTFAAVAGIAFATAIVVAGRFSFDAMELVLELQFERTQREDATVTFGRPVPLGALAALSSIPGVLAVEPLRAMPVRLEHEGRAREVAVLATRRGGALRQIVGMDGVAGALPEEGVVLSSALATALAVKTGDSLRVRRLEGGRAEVRAVVAGTVDDFMGLMAYAELDALARLFGEAPAASGALLRIDPSQRDLALARLEQLPAVLSIDERRATTRWFDEQVAAMVGVFNGMLAIFAGIIAVAVVYNGARIALAVRGRELATLRVLGFTEAEVAAIVIGEQAAIVALGLPLGVLLGRALAAGIVASLDPELYRIPLVVADRTIVLAAVTVLGALAGSALVVRRKVAGLDLVGVLKARD